MKIDWFRVFFYLSLIFLVIWLFRNGNITAPKIVSHQDLIISFAFLFFAFLLDAYSWGAILRESGADIPFKSYFASSGLSVFAKYIPGKIFVILGRVLYLSRNKLIENSRGNSLSLFLQLCSIWAALVLGLLWAFHLGNSALLKISWLGILIICSLWLYIKGIRSRVNALLGTVLKKEIINLDLGLASVLRVSFLMLLYWSFLGLGFAFLLEALGENGDISSALIFPFAAVAGIVAIFAPGGLGVREGIIVAALVATGLNASEATNISVWSRIWYLIGELFLFFSAFLIRGKKS